MPFVLKSKENTTTRTLLRVKAALDNQAFPLASHMIWRGDFLGGLLPFNLGNWGGLIVFALLSATLVYVITGKKKSK